MQAQFEILGKAIAQKQEAKKAQPKPIQTNTVGRLKSLSWTVRRSDFVLGLVSGIFV
jgi:hypothetical protein